jgi:Tfp pilus tip-associated adhesin PilY1
MIINQGSSYESIVDIASADMTEGQFKTLNNISGFTMGNISSGESYALVYKCNKAKANKDSTVLINRGQTVYYNTTNKNITNVVGSNIKVGIALETKAIGTTTILIDFIGV